MYTGTMKCLHIIPYSLDKKSIFAIFDVFFRRNFRRMVSKFIENIISEFSVKFPVEWYSITYRLDKNSIFVIFDGFSPKFSTDGFEIFRKYHFRILCTISDRMV
jgi:hypothetical protein